MKIITRQLLANDAPKRFHAQYGNRIDKTNKGVKWTAISFELSQIPVPVNPDEVDRIIGNSSWTDVPACDECGTRKLPVVIQLGEEPDYESSTVHVCHACLSAAALMLSGKSQAA